MTSNMEPISTIATLNRGRIPRLTLISSTFSDFISSVNQRIDASSEEKLHLIFFVDADNLKQTNDTLGYSAGDELIFGIFNVLKSNFAEDGIIFRKGGDEFLAYCQCDSPGDALLVTEDITTSLNLPFNGKAGRFQMNCSLGVASSTCGYENAVSLIEQANIALLTAKRSGKGQSKFFDNDDCRSVELEQSVIRAFPKALQEGELSMYFQPIYETFQRRAYGGEALVRWNSGFAGHVPANMIVDAAAKTGLALELGKYVLDKACRAARSWPDDMFVSVNFLASDFQYREFSSQALKIISRAGIKPHNVKFEITEIEYLDVTANFNHNLYQLNAAGVCVGVDDFGTGYSSMGSIDKFPASFLKVDRSIVRECNTRQSSRIFLKAISAFAEHASLKVIAEGIETVQELAVVCGTGIKLGQGFYYSPALPEAHFMHHLNRNRMTLQRATTDRP